MRKLTLAFGLACVACLAAPAAMAGGLVKEQVSAQAKWVVHLDVEAAWASALGQFVLDKIEKDGKADQIQKFADVFGFDLTKDLHGITLYGESYNPADGVAIVNATVNKDKLLGLLAQNAGHQEIAYGDFVLQRWTQKPEGPGDDGARYGTFYRDDLVIISRSVTALQHAIDVMGNPASSLAGANAPSLLPPVSAGAFLVAAATDIKLPAEAAPKAAMLKNIAGGSLEFGQDGDNVFLNLRLTTKTDADALRLRQMAQGLLAFAQMAVQHLADTNQPTPPWAVLVPAAVVDGQGREAHLGLSLASQEFTALLAKGQQAK